MKEIADVPFDQHGDCQGEMIALATRGVWTIRTVPS